MSGNGLDKIQEGSEGLGGEDVIGAVSAGVADAAKAASSPEPDIYAELPEKFAFADVIAWIDAHYDFNYTPFSVGELQNTDPETTAKSCKVLAYAKLLGNYRISDRGILDLFAEHYRNVLENPEGTNHANIRALIKVGMSKVQFHGDFPLKRKK